jgi:hypothetical protein
VVPGSNLTISIVVSAILLLISVVYVTFPEASDTNTPFEDAAYKFTNSIYCPISSLNSYGIRLHLMLAVEISYKRNPSAPVGAEGKLAEDAANSQTFVPNESTTVKT